MSNPNYLSVFEALGEAQIRAAEGRQELARIVVRAVARRVRNVFGRVAGRRSRYV
jgi:hypothetical protein